MEFEYENFASFFLNHLRQNITSYGEPDYVAISSLFSPAYDSVVDLTVIARELFPRTTIIVGGNLPTSTYRDLLRDSEEIDAICFGEGDTSRFIKNRKEGFLPRGEQFMDNTWKN